MEGAHIIEVFQKCLLKSHENHCEHAQWSSILKTGILLFWGTGSCTHVHNMCADSSNSHSAFILSPPPIFTKTVGKNCFGCLVSIASVSQLFTSHIHGEILNFFYLYSIWVMDPLPPLSLHCKDRRFSPNFDGFPYGIKIDNDRKGMDRTISLLGPFLAGFSVIVGECDGHTTLFQNSDETTCYNSGS